MTNLLSAVALTGADDLTDPRELREVSREYPLAEWAILLAPEMTGQPRYPQREWIEEFLATCPQAQRSLHLCGQSIHDFIAGEKDVCELASRFNRIQLNFFQRRNPVKLDELEAAITRSARPVIVPYNPSNAAVVESLKTPHQILFDRSGGTGRLPTTGWPQAFSGSECGYAGGLGPDNLEQQLPLIFKAAAGQRIWIDMESSLRDQSGMFSLAAVRQVLENSRKISDRMGLLSGMQPS